MNGRFAPSPTGPLHLGNLRTALIAWLFARSAGSEFLVRVEDLDGVASRPEHADAHLRDLAAIGIDWDGPVLRQSDRFDLYRSVLRDLDDRDLLYRCYCTRREVQDAVQAAHGELAEGKYPGTCRRLSSTRRAELEAAGRPAALRLRGGDSVSFVDRMVGPYTRVVDDFVVQRNDGAPAYNLAVVVDDHLQRVEEVVRGDDLLDTTPRQLHLLALLGWAPPAYAHVPLVLGPDGERLAKRHGAVTLTDLEASGTSVDAVSRRLRRGLGPGAPDELGALVTWFAPERLSRDPWTVRCS